MGKIMEALSKRDKYSTPRETLRRLYAKRDQHEVAEVLGVTQATVSAAMRRLNVTARPRHTLTPKGSVAQELTRRGRTTRRSANQMFILLYRTRGMSLQQIADELFASLESVRRFAIERNIPLRRVGRPRGKTSRSRDQFDINCV